MHKIIFVFSFFLGIQIALQAQIVNIPDANFKAALLAHGSTIMGPNISTIDTNGDGEIQVTEAQAYVGEIDVSNKFITNLEGIEDFVNLDVLRCNDNQLINLDVSNSLALTHLSCNENQLSSLDISNNLALTYLNCSANQLNSLDVSNNLALTILNCETNQLSSLDVSINSNLFFLYCSNNQLGSLDLSNNLALSTLYCSNNQITILDLSNHVSLYEIHCTLNRISHLNVSGNLGLYSLYCATNQLSSLDLSNNIALTHLNCAINQLITLRLPNNSLSSFICERNLSFLEICVPSIVGAQLQSHWIKDVTATYVENCSSLAVDGFVGIDNNSDCQIDSLEDGVSNTLLLLNNGIDSTYALTNSLGNYQAYLDTGGYTVTVLPTHPYWSACPSSQQVTIDTNYQVQTIDFSAQATTVCPYLEVDISTPLLRRCFNSTYYIDFCNRGTSGANNAYVEVQLDTSLYFNSSSIPLVSQNGNVYAFYVGNLPRDTCGRFSIDVTVSCSSELGQIHCASAQMYPNFLCLTTLPNIHIADTCLTDSILFIATNYADAVTLPYLLLEDTVVVDTGSFSLNIGQSASLYYPKNTNGTAMYQLVLANENSVYYTASRVVGCDANSSSTDLLYLPNLPQDFADIDCTPNRGSYDPNDKTGYPLGYTNDHYIQPNSTIDYRIRFQNTGTDTAIFINILDTISPYLDLGTLNMGVASHAYTLQIMPSTPSGEQVLRFQFNPIYLPDSNVNEPASNGFIQYSITQKPNLPNGTIINNSASIYFDYNAPIKTNTTLHTVCDNCYPENITNLGSSTINVTKIDLPKYQVAVIPNPFSTATQIKIQGYEGEGRTLKLEVYDVMGRLQSSLNGNDKGQFFLERNQMPVGVYFFRISENGRLLQSGHLMVGE